MDLAVMLFLLIMAAVRDIQCGKIPNEIVLSGWLLALVLGVYSSGFEGGLYVLQRGAGVIAICWPLFLLHVIGAGDIKLWSVVAAVHSFHFLFGVIVILFGAAGVFSIVVMLYRHLLVKRIQYLLGYIGQGRVYEKYYEQKRDGTEITIKLAPFTACAYGVVLLGRWSGIW